MLAAETAPTANKLISAGCSHRIALYRLRSRRIPSLRPSVDGNKPGINCSSSRSLSLLRQSKVRCFLPKTTTLVVVFTRLRALALMLHQSTLYELFLYELEWRLRASKRTAPLKMNIAFLLCYPYTQSLCLSNAQNFDSTNSLKKEYNYLFHSYLFKNVLRAMEPQAVEGGGIKGLQYQ